MEEEKWNKEKFGPKIIALEKFRKEREESGKGKQVMMFCEADDEMSGSA